MKKVKIQFFLSLSILFCLAGCSLQERSDLDIILINNSSHSLIYLAGEREASNLVDPMDSLVVAYHDDRLVKAGESAEVKDIEGGYSSGDDIRFFLYKVISEEAEKAPLARILDVTYEELEEHDFKVMITDSLLTNRTNDIRIKNGTFFNECGGYCQTEIEIVNADVLFIASSWDDPNYPDLKLDGSISGQEWNSLVELVDMDSLLEIDDVIGCPDCADGGGEWIEITKADRTKRVTFEYGMTVEPIQDLILKVRVIRERFYCEMFPDRC